MRSGSQLIFCVLRNENNFDYSNDRSAAKFLITTENPMYLTKVIAASEDNSVRVFSSHGQQLNVQILPEDTLDVVSAVYSGNKCKFMCMISLS